MEAIACLACGLTAAAGAWVALGARARPATGVRSVLLARRARGWLAALGRAWMPRALLGAGAWRAAAEALRRRPRARCWALSLGEASAALAAAVCLASAAAALVSLSWIGALVGAAAAGAAVVGWAAAQASAGRAAAAREVPVVFRSLAAAMGSGRTLAQAIAYVGAQGTGPVSGEFRRASMAIACGTSATEALGGLGCADEVPGMGLMLSALEVSGRTGAPLHGLFLKSARLVERQAEFERTLMAKTAQVRLSARIVSVLPAVLVGALALLSPDYRAGMGTPVGVGCVAAACVLDATALFAIRRLMRGVV